MSPTASLAARSEARPSAARIYPQRPCLGVSVAVFRAGRVLLARRTKPPFAGAFSLPGGLVEVGETLEVAALRELHEEVGVDAQIVAFNRHMESIDRDSAGKIRHHYVIASFVGEWIAGEAKPGLEAGEVVWVEPARIAGLDCTPQLAGMIEAAQRVRDARIRAGQP
jgi:8-oxo-dGTP diphosphatase